MRLHSLFLTLFCLAPPAAYSQMQYVSGQTSVPRPGLGQDYIQLLDETVNPGNGSVNVQIQIPQPPGRGLTLPFSISYNSGSVWQLDNTGSGEGVGAIQVEPVPGNFVQSVNGWAYSIPMVTYKSAQLTLQPLNPDGTYAPGSAPDVSTPNTTCSWSTSYVFYDPSGRGHPLGLGALYMSPSQIAECPQPTQFSNIQQHGDGGSSIYSYVEDGGDTFTKAHLYLGLEGTPQPANFQSQVATADGTTYNFAGGGLGGNNEEDWEITSPITDRNGNTYQISSSASFGSVSAGAAGSVGTVTYHDSIGRPSLILTADHGAHGNNSANLDTIAVSGLPNPYTIHWEQLSPVGATVHGNTIPFGNNVNCPASSGQIPLGGVGGVALTAVKQITLPNGTSYQFTYDNVYGLLQSITYPNGATVTYQWQMQPRFEQTVLSWVLSQNPWVLWDYLTFNSESNGGGTGPTDISIPCSFSYDWPVIASRTVNDGTRDVLTQTFQYTGNYTTSAMDRTTTVTTTDNIQGTTAVKVIHYNLSADYSSGWLYNDPYSFDSPSIGLTALGGATYVMGPIARPTVLNIPVEDTNTDMDSSGHVLRTETKVWYASPDLLGTQVTTLNGNVTSTVNNTYEGVENSPFNHMGRLASTTQIDYDGTQVVTTYHHAPPPAGSNQFQYGASIFDRLSSVTKSLTSGGTPIAETDYGSYDNNGNAQTVTKCLTWTQTSCAGPVTNFTFNTYGQVTKQTDPNNNSTLFDYTDNFTTGGPPPSPTSAYPTMITYPPTSGVAHVEHFAYDYASGHLNGAEDENGNWTYYKYADLLGNPDPLGRLMEVDYPDGGKTNAAYNDTLNHATMSVSQLAGPTVTSVLDGMYRVTQTQRSAAGTATAYTDTVYNGAGQVYSVSNPYYTTSDPAYGITNYIYDAIGRKTSQTQPDGTTRYWCYEGYPTTSAYCHANASAYFPSGDWADTTDETGRHTQQGSDALGRLRTAMEPDPSSGSLALETDYGYDGLSNLLSVNQKGNSTDSPRVRSFTYDSLSRLVTSANPETGSISYSYLNSTAALCAGDVSLPCSKTDARGVTTSYFYDNLNRLVQKGYPVLPAASPAKYSYSCYQYDTTSIPGASTSGNFVSRVTNSWTQISTSQPSSFICSSSPPATGALSRRSVLAYDPMGRLQSEQQCTAASCGGTVYTPSYTYDLAGRVSTHSNGIPNGPGSFTFTHVYDNAGRLSSVTSSNTLYPTNLFTAGTSSPSSGCSNAFSTAYSPAGGLSNATFGVGLQLSRGYDPRLRVNCEIDIGNSAQNPTPGTAAIVINGTDQTH